MRPHALAAAVLALSLSLTACRSSQRSTLADGQTPVEACRAEVEGVDLSRWREVRGDGFTFCVPGDWRASGRIVERADSRVEWNVGVPAPGKFGAPAIGSGDVRPRGAMGVQPANYTESVRFTETIDGRQAELYREALSRIPGEDFRGAYLIGAQWIGPAIHFTGKANEIEDAELQFVIFRTVDFDDR